MLVRQFSIWTLRKARPAVIAALLLAVSGGFGLAMAESSSRLASAPITEAMVLGCWERQQPVPDDGNYWSLCFLENGGVESAVISGPPGAGLSGTASGGSFEISSGRIKFSFDPGDYGWLWESGSVVCDASLEGEERIGFTNCNGGEPDMQFEREKTAAP